MKDQLSDFLKKYKYDFLVWGIYYVYETATAGILTRTYPLLDCCFFYYNALHVFLFYFHSNVLLKYALEGKKNFASFSLIIILVLIELALFIFIKYEGQILIEKYIQHNVQHFNLKKYFPHSTYLIPALYRSIYFIGFSTGYYFLMRTRSRRQQLEDMKQQKLLNLIEEKEIIDELAGAQNAFLRSQINPDFLIMTLNHLYNETIDSAPKAAESILSLSDIMQYALSKEAATGFVKLEKEISLIENFILLHQARQVHQVQLIFSYNKESLSVEFIPLVLMTLIENMLKHGKLDEPDNPARIKINYENSVLCIETANKEFVNNSIPSHGIGLKNIKERLFLTYGRMATFDYRLDAKGYFHTAIIVQL